MDKLKQWALLTVVAIVALAAGGWFVFISPQRSHASDLRTQVTAQNSQNEQLRTELASLQSQHKGLPQVQAELAKLGVQLPNNPGLPSLIRALSAAADAAGVDLISMAPAQPTPVTTTTTAAAPQSQAAAVGAATSTSSNAGSAAPAAAAPPSTGTLENVAITVIVNGGYFQVEQFVSNLEAFARPFLTTQIQMQPQAPSGPSSTSAAGSSGQTAGYTGHVQATISGQVFMVNQQAASASRSAAPTATSATK